MLNLRIILDTRQKQMIPREAQSKYVSDVIKIHLFLQDILTLLAKNTKKIRFSGLYCIYAVMPGGGHFPGVIVSVFFPLLPTSMWTFWALQEGTLEDRKEALP